MLRDREPERLRCLEVDDEVEAHRLLDGEVGGLGALENAVWAMAHQLLGLLIAPTLQRLDPQPPQDHLDRAAAAR